VLLTIVPFYTILQHAVTSLNLHNNGKNNIVFLLDIVFINLLMKFFFVLEDIAWSYDLWNRNNDLISWDIILQIFKNDTFLNQIWTLALYSKIFSFMSLRFLQICHDKMILIILWNLWVNLSSMNSGNNFVF